LYFPFIYIFDGSSGRWFIMLCTKVTISIVAYNSKNVLIKCIDSILEPSKGIDMEIIVVDNKSQDGSPALIKNLFPGVRLIENNHNVGFGKAHNQSFKISQGEYFLILNPDTVIFPNAIKRMVDFMDSRKKVGVLGCKIFWDDDKMFMFPDLRIHSLKTALFQFTSFCHYFPNNRLSQWYWKSAYPLWETTMPQKVEGITGGLMMVRREIFESVGLFDENFFLFFEEHDLLRRVKKTEAEIFYLPTAEIQHYFEESVRHSNLDIGTIYLKSAFYYYQKHYKKFGTIFLKFLLVLNKFLLQFAQKFLSARNIYKEIISKNDTLIIEWPPCRKAEKYIIEISYSPNFSDRAGMFVYGETFSLKSDVLNRLPNNTGFLRILPVYADHSIGKVIRVIKITSPPIN
jgi:GT2 family glycosyltransferase